MPTAHVSTQAVIAQCAEPDVLTDTEFRAALRAFLPVLNRVSQQVACIQALASVANLDEEDGGIRQRYHGLQMSLRAVQNKHDKAIDVLLRLQNAWEGMQSEAEGLVTAVTNAGTSSDSPAETE